MLLECSYVYITDDILRVRWCKGCSFHMYASVKSVAVRVCLGKNCTFHMYASVKFSVVKVWSYKAVMLLKQTSF